MRLKLITAAVLAVLTTGCATRDLTGHTLMQDTQTGAAAAVREAAQMPSAVNDINAPYLDFKSIQAPPVDGGLTLNAASSAFGPLMMTAARKSGYSVVFAENVNTSRKITVDFNRADPEKALREMAYLAGYVAVLDKSTKTFTVAETATVTFKVPTSLFHKLSAKYSVGGNPVSTAGGSGGGSGSSGGSSGGASGSNMQANFVIDGTEGSDADAVTKVIKGIAGKNAEVTVSNIGIIVVRSNAQSLKRVETFLKGFVRDAMTEVDIEASIVEVSLGDNFQFGINWSRVLNNASVLGSAGRLNLGFNAPTADAPSFTANFTGANINTIITALRNLSDTKVISQPHILAVNDTPSTFFDGTQLPYLGSITSTSTGTTGNTQTTGSTSFAVDGISFSVQPHVLDDRHVQLTLIPVLSNVEGFDTFNLGSNGGQLTAPRQANKQSYMKVMAENGKTIILGGIRYSSEVKNTNASPIPFLAQGKQTNGKAKEVVILLRANVINPPEYDPVDTESI